MTPPTVRVNTFVQTDKPYLYTDFISKFCVFLQTLTCSQRLYTLCNLNIPLRLMLLAYNIIVYSLLLIVATEKNFWYRVLTLLQVFVYTILSYFLRNRLTSFYNELNIFDKHVGCTPKVTWLSIQNLIQMISTCLMHIILLTLFKMDIKVTLYFMFVSVALALEISYYGHLLSLFVPRLKLINYGMGMSLSGNKRGSILKDYFYVKGNRKCEDTPFSMRKIADLYLTMVNAFDFLIDSIKWQLLLTIIITFSTLLYYCYGFCLLMLRGPGFVQELAFFYSVTVGWSIAIMVPLFSPCVLADSVQRQVKKLRELLASRLHENKLDKTSRSITRALLAFTETRNLSFRLLRILDIDISLPFKFVGLLITYLIIILQFEKVINPQNRVK